MREAFAVSLAPRSPRRATRSGVAFARNSDANSAASVRECDEVSETLMAIQSLDTSNG